MDRDDKSKICIGGQVMDEEQRRTMLKGTFDTVAPGYDGGALRFFPASAENMVSLLSLCGDEHVLDVACGTGHTSLAAARKLPRGHVTAVDFSAGMLDQARRKAATYGIGNIDFQEGDMAALPFPADAFDVAICAFGIFFVDDMEAQLAHITSVVKPGGKIMISSFHEGHYFAPLGQIANARLAKYGLQSPPQTWKRIANDVGCTALFKSAAMTAISVESRNVGYHLHSAEQWWDVIWNTAWRGRIGQLSPGDREEFKREHLQEVAALATKDGIWLDVGVLYTTGTKPT